MSVNKLPGHAYLISVASETTNKKKLELNIAYKSTIQKIFSRFKWTGAASYAKIADKFSRDFKNLKDNDLEDVSIKPAIQKLGDVNKKEASSQLKSIDKSLQKIFNNTYQSIERLNKTEAVNQVLLPGLLARSNLLFDNNSRSLLPTQNRKTLIADLGRMIELGHTFQNDDVEDLLSLFRNLFPRKISGEYYQLLNLAAKIQFSDEESKEKFLEEIVICDDWKGSIPSYYVHGEKMDPFDDCRRELNTEDAFNKEVDALLGDHMFSKINACIDRHKINVRSSGNNVATLAVKVFSLPHLLQTKLQEGTATLDELKKYQEIQTEATKRGEILTQNLKFFDVSENFSESTALEIVENSIKTLEKELQRAVKLNLTTQDELREKIATAQEILQGLGE